MTKLQQHMQRLEKGLHSSQIEAAAQVDEQRRDLGCQLLADLLCYHRGGLHSLLIYGILGRHVWPLLVLNLRAVVFLKFRSEGVLCASSSFPCVKFGMTHVYHESAEPHYQMGCLDQPV